MENLNRLLQLERRIKELEEKQKSNPPRMTSSFFSNNYQKETENKMLLNMRNAIDLLKERVKVLESELKKVINEQNKG